MKLSPEQDKLLDQLCAQLQAASFREAKHTLEALETQPFLSPALIPELLPALVRRAHEQTFLQRVRQTLKPSSNIADEEIFHAKLAGLLARCLSLADASDLIELDEA